MSLTNPQSQPKPPSRGAAMNTAPASEALRDFLINGLGAKDRDVLTTHGPQSATVTFAIAGVLTGSLTITAQEINMTYIVANMWENREHAEFERIEDAQEFLSRLVRLVRRFSRAAFPDADNQ